MEKDSCCSQAAWWFTPCRTNGGSPKELFEMQLQKKMAPDKKIESLNAKIRKLEESLEKKNKELTNLQSEMDACKLIWFGS